MEFITISHLLLQNSFNEIEIVNCPQLAGRSETSHILPENRKKAKESGSLNRTLPLEERGRKNKRLAKLLDFRLITVFKKKGKGI